MSSSTDSDDDPMLSSSLSKKKRRKRSPLKKKSTPKKSRISKTVVPIHEKRSDLEWCINCQMPLELLHRWESDQVHASSCLEIEFKHLPSCPDGRNCDCTIRSHFTKFNHLELASFRDNSSLLLNKDDDRAGGDTSSDFFQSVQESVQAPKSSNVIELSTTNNEEFATEKSDDSSIKVILDQHPKAGPSSKFKFKSTTNVKSKYNYGIETGGDDSSIKIILDDPNAAAGQKSVVEKSSKFTFKTKLKPKPVEYEDAFETAKSHQDNLDDDDDDTIEDNDDDTDDDDDDELFERLTNNALDIEAVKDEVGGIEINIKVNSKIDLEHLVMRIPSHCLDQSGAKIDVIGKINAKHKKKKQQTLDSFFGLKPAQNTQEFHEKAKAKGFSTSIESYQDKKRTCPFYKKIPETSFTVDAFNFGIIPGISHYFLSHFHYDHYGGMTKKWTQPVICSPITAKLIALKIRMEYKYLKIVQMNTPTVIENVEITLLDANHCPGSVMFLFKLPRNGQVFLHVGDFRASAEMEEFPELWNNKIDKLYLDTTYCKPDYDFPSQSSVICATVDMVKSHLETYPKSLICVGSYTIGKERIFTAIAEKIDAQIWAATEKSRVLRALDDPIIKSRLVSTAMLAKLHVLDMAKVRQKSALSDHLNKFKGKFDEILSIVPTGWSHEKGTSSDLSLSSMKIKNYRDNVFVLNVPYSEHSSYSEMKRFVQFLKLDNSEKILATVNVGNPETRNAQKALFKQWIDEMNHRPNQFKKTSTLMTRR